MDAVTCNRFDRVEVVVELSLMPDQIWRTVQWDKCCPMCVPRWC